MHNQSCDNATSLAPGGMAKHRQRRNAVAAMTVWALACIMTYTTPAWGGVDLIVSQSGDTTSLRLGSNDPFHTTDNVFIQNPEVGNWTIRVDADFALVVSGKTDILHACCLPNGRGCSDKTQGSCDLLGGDLLFGSTCSDGPVLCPSVE